MPQILYLYYDWTEVIRQGRCYCSFIVEYRTRIHVQFRGASYWSCILKLFYHYVHIDRHKQYILDFVIHRKCNIGNTVGILIVFCNIVQVVREAILVITNYYNVTDTFQTPSLILILFQSKSILIRSVSFVELYSMGPQREKTWSLIWPNYSVKKAKYKLFMKR